LGGRVETVGVPGPQVGGLEDPHIDVALLEHVLHEVLLRVLHELLERPVSLGRTKAHVSVKALDPPLRVLLLPLDPVLGTRVPEMQVTVNDEVLLTVPLVHLVLPLSSNNPVDPNVLRANWCG